MFLLFFLTACGVLTDKDGSDTFTGDLVGSDRDSGMNDSGTNGGPGGPGGDGTGDGT